MLPSFAITFSLSIVSLLPTTSDSTRGRYFSTHGSSPSIEAADDDGDEEVEEDEGVVVDVGLVEGLVGDGACFLGVGSGCSVSITSSPSSSSCTSWISSSDMAASVARLLGEWVKWRRSGGGGEMRRVKRGQNE